jgi:hypothetical protein
VVQNVFQNWSRIPILALFDTSIHLDTSVKYLKTQQAGQATRDYESADLTAELEERKKGRKEERREPEVADCEDRIPLEQLWSRPRRGLGTRERNRDRCVLFKFRSG